jgi:hypothetical protein
MEEDTKEYEEVIDWWGEPFCPSEDYEEEKI